MGQKINLGAQLMKCHDIKEYPILIKKMDDKEWQNFFLKIAKKLGDKV